MTAVLQHSGEATNSALAGAMLFRLVQVWLPVAVGLAFLLKMPRLDLGRVVQRVQNRGYAFCALFLLSLSAMPMMLAADRDESWIMVGDGVVFATLAFSALGTLLMLNVRRRTPLVSARATSSNGD
jgi:hypothetical protein